MNSFPAALGLGPDQTEQVIRAAGRAPSLHNSQPWRFRLRPKSVELHSDPQRRMPVADPRDRELRLACGAALFSLRLALAHHGVHPSVTTAASRVDSTLLAVVRAGGSASSLGIDREELFRAIANRRTNRRPFMPTPVPRTARNSLVGAVETEHCRLHVVDREQRARVVRLVHRAHELQLADEDFRTEMARWTGKRADTREGVPVSAAGPRPEVQDEWVLRDFSGGQADERTSGKDFEDDPLTVVLCSAGGTHAGELQAGQAMQRLLLTATVLGLSASLLSQVVEVDESRRELRALFGDEFEPQAVLRIGYGSPVPDTPRREPTELLLR